MTWQRNCSTVSFGNATTKRLGSGRRGVIRENDHGGDGQVVLFSQPGEVVEHALGKVRLRFCLVLNMDEEEGVPPRNLAFINTSTSCLSQHNIGKEFFVHRDSRGCAVGRGTEVGQEQVYELDGEGGQKLFEEAVAVHQKSVSEIEAKQGSGRLFGSRPFCCLNFPGVGGVQ